MQYHKEYSIHVVSDLDIYWLGFKSYHYINNVATIAAFKINH